MRFLGKSAQKAAFGGTYGAILYQWSGLRIFTGYIFLSREVQKN